MRVAFFTDSYLPTHDGVAQVTAGIAHALAAGGDSVTIHTVRLPGSPSEEAPEDGIEIVRYRAVSAPSYPEYRIATWPWFPDLRRRRADVVHVHTPGFVGLAGWWASHRRGIPSVGTFHTNLPDMLRASPHGRPARWFFRQWGEFSRRLCWWCDVPTAPTVEAARVLGEGYPDADAAPIRVIGNGVDIKRFRPSLSEPDWHARLQAEELPLVTFLGRLTRDKGVLRFLDAVANVPPSLSFRAVVAGVGPLAPEIVQRIARSPELARRVRFVGAVPEKEKPALLAQSQLFVLPSTGDTSSVAVLEAMACGSAPVVTSRGGPAALVQPGTTGLLVDPMSTGQLGIALADLLEHPDRARALGKQAAEWVCAHASIGQVASAYRDLYAELLQRS